jgi:predicted small secreted protein
MTHRRSRRRTTLALAICALLGAAVILSGCDDTSSGLGRASDGSRRSDEIRSAGSVTVDELCGLFRDEPSKLAGLSTAATRRSLANDITTLYRTKNALNAMDGVAIDAKAASCPREAADVMAQARILSFAQL